MPSMSPSLRNNVNQQPRRFSVGKRKLLIIKHDGILQSLCGSGNVKKFFSCFNKRTAAGGEGNKLKTSSHNIASITSATNEKVVKCYWTFLLCAAKRYACFEKCKRQRNFPSAAFLLCLLASIELARKPFFMSYFFGVFALSSKMFFIENGKISFQI